MNATRNSCLCKALELGFKLQYDPPGSSNRCFYECVARFLGLNDDQVDDVVNNLETFMINNQVIPIKNEHGIVVEDINFYDFLSDVDFPSHGYKRPELWNDTVMALRGEMTTHAVIVATALLFGLEITIIDSEGRLTKIPPEQWQQKPGNPVYLAYTEDHYMLLKRKVKPVKLALPVQETMSCDTKLKNNCPTEHDMGMEAGSGNPSDEMEVPMDASPDNSPVDSQV